MKLADIEDHYTYIVMKKLNSDNFDFIGAFKETKETINSIDRADVIASAQADGLMVIRLSTTEPIVSHIIMCNIDYKGEDV